MNELREQFEKIRAAAQTLALCADKDEADRLLGELDALVHDTRQTILDEYSVARTANLRLRTSKPAALDDLI